MTTRLELICHASTAATRTVAFPADEPLDALGRRKLAGLARMRSADICLTSPALRAVETARALELAAEVDPMLRDCDHGRWAGRSLEEVQAREPEAVAAWLRDPGAAPHGGESVLALIARVAAWLDARRAAPAKIVAVTHASVIRAAIVHALEAGPRTFWRIDVAPLSLTRLGSHPQGWTLTSLGAIDRQAGEP